MLVFYQYQLLDELQTVIYKAGLLKGDSKNLQKVKHKLVPRVGAEPTLGGY